MAQTVKARTGGSLVAESLEALGAEVAFGVPGIHALAIWEGLRTSSIRTIGVRTELSAGFAADGYARTSGRPAPLLLSTGPGALISLAALMEAASAHVPVVAIASQIPRELIGAGRGFLHELPDQLASFAPVVKWAARAEGAAEIPELLAEGWRRALTPPSGPVFVEIPVDLLAGETGALPGELDPEPEPLPLPDASALDEAAYALANAMEPAVWAGGGVLRSGAWEELRAVAERLGAPVATTYMGKGAFPEDDPAAVGTALDEQAVRELLGSADVLLAVGTELGAETTGQYGLELSGLLIHVDADPRRIGRTYEALGLAGDAKAVLAALAERLPGPAREDAAGRVAAVHERIAEVRGEPELGLLQAIRETLPRDAVTAWDMTILAYWAAAHFPVYEPRTFHYPLGSGTLGYAWPAALGASLAAPGRRVLAIAGDGGFNYGIAELAAARQHSLDAKLLLVDDGGYGILREYQRDQFGEITDVDLVEPDFRALVEAFGVPVVSVEPDGLAEALAAAFAERGPAVVHLRAFPEMWS
ncbi:MAG TPA: thiamine pyrophosphate-binding protein [Gaiellaceae bacterium]|nr:thiamine pyrophosphate-binding protein [Gaiellaceae bacterium]HXV96340.1 thiamine pyrophosphate-binding protein [Gaiellaceae bacterium]